MTPAVNDAISLHARARSLPRQLVEAIVLTESQGIPTAYRVEPAYRYLWDVAKRAPFRSLTAAERKSERAPHDFPHLPISSRDTEWWGQASSWGPMQVMGAVAREHGFTGPFPGLCDPGTGIAYGCRYLAHLRDRYLRDFGWEGVAAAYNAGSPRKDDDGRWANQSYVDSVRRNGGFDVSDAS